MKRIRLTRHATEQRIERGCTEEEVRQAVTLGIREPAKHGRLLCRYNFEYNALWQGRHYAVKQVAPVIAEESAETVVVTVYVFYF
ncbi:MAG TPA: hypothetical protein VNE39_17635 [Planctomycetota bacterium]|nr:hypothetical protein [Planctomycetota bacterium]